MKRMLKGRLALLALCVLLGTVASCATSDGGVGGTGIATVRGNVLDPELVHNLQNVGGNGASAAGIVVRVRDTSVSDETDDLGFFELAGEIAGEITIDFVRDDHPIAATQPVVVPVDAEVTLKDITLLDDVAAPDVIELDNVIATVIAPPRCEPDGSGSFLLRDDGGFTFAVTITVDTVLTDTRGTIACAEVTEESQVKFRGFQENAEVTASDLRVLKLGRPATP
jgi:hypothetical protein